MSAGGGGTALDLTPAHLEGGASRPVLITLARIEARRYVRHPLFLLGVAALIGTAGAQLSNGELLGEISSFGFYAAFFLGLFGALVGHHLARSTDVSREVVDVAAVPRATRTAAVCVACLVPAATAALWLLVVYVVARVVYPPEDVFWTGGHDTPTRVAVCLASIVACAGGPIFGVMVARWTRFPGSGLLAVLLLFFWTGLGSVWDVFDEPSRLSALLRLQAPFSSWQAWDGPHEQFPTYQPEGSAVAHLAYGIGLCVLGVIVAMLRDAQGEQRRRLIRAVAVTGAVTLVCLGLTAAPEPVRTILETRHI